MLTKRFIVLLVHQLFRLHRCQTLRCGQYLHAINRGDGLVKLILQESIHGYVLLREGLQAFENELLRARLLI